VSRQFFPGIFPEMDELRITRDEAKEIVSDYLATSGVLHKTFPQKTPTIVLVAGQPGAGKTGLAEESKSYLRERGGYIRIDADRLREMLPYYPRLAQEDPLNASARSQQDASLCVQELRKMAIEEKRNIMEEGTFRSPDDAERFVSALKTAGNRVELRILAVPPEHSLLGIYQRYEEQLEGGIIPRNVKDAYHNAAFVGLRKTIARVETMVDRCTVHNRDGNVLHDSLEDKGSILPVVEKVQNTISSQQKAVTASEWNWIYARVLNRNETGERRLVIEQHLINAHRTLRADPVASQLYDRYVPPVVSKMSQALAHYSGSSAEKLHQAVDAMQVKGLSTAALEKVMTRTSEKLKVTDIAAPRKAKSTKPLDHPPAEQNGTTD